MGRHLHTLHRAVLMSQKLAKSNVQTSLCDRREPANASSLYLAVLTERKVTRSLRFPSKQCSLSRLFDCEHGGLGIVAILWACVPLRLAPGCRLFIRLVNGTVQAVSDLITMELRTSTAADTIFGRQP